MMLGNETFWNARRISHNHSSPSLREERVGRGASFRFRASTLRPSRLCGVSPCSKMLQRSRPPRALLSALIASVFLFCMGVQAANTLNWNTNQNRVTADIKGTELLPVLEHIASVTGWHVFIEQGTIHNPVSAKFKDLPTGQALHLLLGDVNFALVPELNTRSKLYVFRTSQDRATQVVQAGKLLSNAPPSKVIPNELIVRLKPGANIDEIARLFGAKVTGRIDSLNAYRLQFEDAASADSARKSLATNSDVAA